MAEEQETTAPKAQAASSESDESFDRDRLISESQDFLGQPSHVVAGALYGNEQETFTVAETEALIQTWLETPIEED